MTWLQFFVPMGTSFHLYNINQYGNRILLEGGCFVAMLEDMYSPFISHGKASVEILGPDCFLNGGIWRVIDIFKEIT